MLADKWRTRGGDKDDKPRAESPASLSTEEWVNKAKSHEQNGELFRAHEIAMQGLAEHRTDLALKYREVLYLASRGPTREASDKFATLFDDAGEAAPTRSLRVDRDLEI